MNEISEVLKGLTDLPIAAVSLVLGILSAKRRDAKDFTRFFFIIAIAAAIGASIHIFKTDYYIRKIIWAVLFVFLFECIRRFIKIFIEFFAGREIREPMLSYIIEAIALALAIIMLFAVDKFDNVYDMACLLVFAGIGVIRLVAAIIKFKNFPKKAIIFAVCIPALLICQSLEYVIDYVIVYEHGIITILLFTIYSFKSRRRSPEVHPI